MNKDTKEQYKTLFILCIGFCLVAWRFHSLYLGIVALLVLGLGLASPILLRSITSTWLWLGEKVGAVMSRVILAIIFIFILTPIALLYRLFSRKQYPNPSSYFVDRNHQYMSTDMEKLF